MYTVNISLQDDEPEVGPYTILIFDVPFLTQLVLSTLVISAAQLAALLRHLTLPALKTLRLTTPEIDPMVLGKFLLRHTKLKELQLDFWAATRLELSSPLVSPEIAHPTLTRIKVFGVENICFTIECLYLSPLLATFNFSVLHSDLTGLNPAFSLIAQRALDAHLSLTIDDDGLEAIPGTLAEETVSIAQNLHCLRSVSINCYSTHIALRVLPWLALFPTLLKVRFGRLIRRQGAQRQDVSQSEGEWQKFMTEANNVLAHVPDVRGWIN
ncbi:hypothetical protein B0H16DRAFT_1579937 [Mycena metata]|uniref:Uncharacterized protein n=1 Tax=Mycena metata TaxID=1033252 RepID=A0AAD7I222_9AGAR|nr:hypothetical protein B0H16DRAFT_1579937 [Mycena metata]